MKKQKGRSNSPGPFKQTSKRRKKPNKVATLSQISQDCDRESAKYRSVTEPGTVSGGMHIEFDKQVIEY